MFPLIYIVLKLIGILTSVQLGRGV